MALPDFTPPPPVPARTQDPGTFNTRVAAFLTWLVTFVIEVTAFSEAIPEEVDSRIQGAIAAYDPEGNYSAAQVDALLSKQANDAYFLAMTS